MKEWKLVAQNLTREFEAERANKDAEIAGLRNLVCTLDEYVQHESGCILSKWQSGRPTATGYEQKFAGKWYLEPPPCECGLDEIRKRIPVLSRAVTGGKP